MTDFILAAVITVIIFLAVRHLHKAKKQGLHCVGCPASKCCSAGKGKSSCCSVQKK